MALSCRACMTAARVTPGAISLSSSMPFSGNGDSGRELGSNMESLARKAKHLVLLGRFREEGPSRPEIPCRARPKSPAKGRRQTSREILRFASSSDNPMLNAFCRVAPSGQGPKSNLVKPKSISNKARTLLSVYSLNGSRARNPTSGRN